MVLSHGYCLIMWLYNIVNGYRPKAVLYTNNVIISLLASHCFSTSYNILLCRMVILNGYSAWFYCMVISCGYVSWLNTDLLFYCSDMSLCQIVT